MTQIMQPDVGESGLPSHSAPNPIQSDSAVSSSRNTNSPPLDFRVRCMFRRAVGISMIRGPDLESPSRIFPVAKSMLSHRYVSIRIYGRQSELILGLRQSHKSKMYVRPQAWSDPGQRAHIRYYQETSPAQVFEMFDFFEWIGSLRHFLE